MTGVRRLQDLGDTPGLGPSVSAVRGQASRGGRLKARLGAEAPAGPWWGAGGEGGWPR